MLLTNYMNYEVMCPRAGSVNSAARSDRSPLSRKSSILLLVGSKLSNFWAIVQSRSNSESSASQQQFTFNAQPEERSDREASLVGAPLGRIYHTS